MGILLGLGDTQLAEAQMCEVFPQPVLDLFWGKRARDAEGIGILGKSDEARECGSRGSFKFIEVFLSKSLRDCSGSV